MLGNPPIIMFDDDVLASGNVGEVRRAISSLYKPVSSTPFCSSQNQKYTTMRPKITVLLVIFLFHFYPIIASDPDPVQDFCIPESKPGPILRTVRLTQPTCKNASHVTVDDFVFQGIKSPGNFTPMGFAGVSVNPSIFPGLNTLGMSFARADLEVDGVNVPHLHPRATEIALVVEGTVYAGFVDSANRVFAKVIRKGEVMIFPKGLVHFQMNVGDAGATIFASFNSQSPGVERIPIAIFGSGIKGELLEKAFGLNSKEVEMLRRKFRP
ncbi:hypothetical protein ACLOJK_031338 [Asimina triloba]